MGSSDQPPSPPTSSSSPVSKRAMETIALLRRQLEQCQIDLQTDEELFAEKTDELNELQTSYEELVREKERIEALWLTAQESEGLLQSELHQVYQQVSLMAKELSSKEEVLEKQREWIERWQHGEGRSEIEKIEREDIEEDPMPSEVLLMPGPSVGGVSEERGVAMGEGETPRPLQTPEMEEFMYSRSVLQGKVKTGSMEVRWGGRMHVEIA